MADPITLLVAARDAALAALDADNYQLARKHALKAQMIIATVPDSSMAAVSSQSWGRSAIKDFLAGIDSLESSAVASEGCGITTCPIEFSTRGSDGGCSC